MHQENRNRIASNQSAISRKADRKIIPNPVPKRPARLCRPFWGAFREIPVLMTAKSKMTTKALLLTLATAEGRRLLSPPPYATPPTHRTQSPRALASKPARSHIPPIPYFRPSCTRTLCAFMPQVDRSSMARHAGEAVALRRRPPRSALGRPHRRCCGHYAAQQVHPGGRSRRCQRAHRRGVACDAAGLRGRSSVR